MSSECVEWSTMIEDVKKYIVGLLDYESRSNLRMCSKSDLALVDSTPFVAEFIAITESDSEMDENKTIIRLDIDFFTIWFTGKNNITKVDRAWDGELSELIEVKQESRYDVARRYIDRHFPDGVLAADEITIVALKMNPPENWKLCCESLELEGFENEEHVSWLKQTEYPLRSLSVRPYYGAPLVVTPSILSTSECLRIYWECDMTDEQLEQVEAVDIQVNSLHITPDAVRMCLEKFLKFGEREDCFQFKITLPEDFEYEKLLPKSVKYRKLENSDDWIIFECLILGGFSNENDVVDARRFHVSGDPEMPFIKCSVPQKERVPCKLWPLTRFD